MCNRACDRGYLVRVSAVCRVSAMLQPVGERSNVATGIECCRVTGVIAQQRDIILEAVGRCCICLELRRGVRGSATLEFLSCSADRGAGPVRGGFDPEQVVAAAA